MISRPASWFMCVFLLCAIVTTAAAAEPASETLIKAGHLLDVRQGRMLSDQGILVRGDRIAAVGPYAAVAKLASAAAERIDLASLTVLPGLIDCHAHILGDLDDLRAVAPLRTSSAQATLWGVHNLGLWLEHGFTTLRDAAESDLGYGQLALRDSINIGLIKGPRLVSAGNYISVTGGHGDADVMSPDNALPRRPNLADNVAEIGAAVRHDLKYGVDWIKLIATGGISDPFSDYNVQELSEAQMAEAVAIAHRAHRKVMAHAEGADGIKAAVRAGVDSIEHGTLLDDEGAALMASRGAWLVPTLSVFQRYAAFDGHSGLDPVALQKAREILKYQASAFRRALDHGVKIAFGLDDDPRYLPRELPAMVAGGMTPLAALRAATINAAELLGLSDRVGSIEPGKFADLLAVRGDPLSDIGAAGAVAFVMKGGEVFERPDRAAKPLGSAP